MQQLTKNFNFSEFIVSPKADAKGIDKSPSGAQLPLILETAGKIAEQLERIRECLDSPITITSAFRNDAVNRLVKGVPSSYHRYKWGSERRLVGAVDIESAGHTSTEIAKIVVDLKLPFYKLLLECPENGNDGWIHLSYHPRRERDEGREVRTVVRDSVGNKSYIKGVWERIR